MRSGASAAIIRRAAAGLAAVAERGRALDEVLDDVSPELRRSVSHLLFNYFRHRRFVDALLAEHLHRSPRPKVYALLRAAAALIKKQMDFTLVQGGKRKQPRHFDRSGM